jgi:hypothetical protein
MRSLAAAVRNFEVDRRLAGQEAEASFSASTTMRKAELERTWQSVQ